MYGRALDNALDLSVLDGVADYAQTSDEFHATQLAGHTLVIMDESRATRTTTPQSWSLQLRRPATHWGSSSTRRFKC
jgi:hypothetical protein